MSKKQIIHSDISTVLSTEELAEIDAELAHVPYKSGAAIDALKIVQGNSGAIEKTLSMLEPHLSK